MADDNAKIIFIGLLGAAMAGGYKVYKNMQKDDVAKLVLSKANQFGFNDADVALTLAIIEQESDYIATARRAEPKHWADHIAKNPKYASNPWKSQMDLWGSWGLGQLLYETALDLGFDPNQCPTDLLDPNINVTLTMTLIQNLQHRFGKNNPTDVISAYNSGQPVSRAPDVTRNTYVPKVWSRLQNLMPYVQNMIA